LYYHARSYDPAIGRFVSADSVVPGAGALTVAPSDATAAAAWAQRGGGPANPQELNRYSYALNNPVRFGDPTGHCIEPLSGIMCVGGALLAKFLFDVVVVVVGGALIYDSVNQMVDEPADSNAGEQADPDAGISVSPKVQEIPEEDLPTRASSGRATNVAGYAPDQPLPRNEDGEPIPSSSYPHTQLGVRTSKTTGETYRQTREWNEGRRRVKRTDWTDHRRPKQHTNPYDHYDEPNPTGGTPRGGKAHPR
jgi:RHS repeat-associated protein